MINKPPQPYIQNYRTWCWAVCAKMVGMAYWRTYPQFRFSILDERGLGDRQRGLVSPAQYAFGVPVAKTEGLRRKSTGLCGGVVTVDAWQNAIVMGSTLSGDTSAQADDACKIRALHFAVTGNAYSREITACSLGRFDRNDLLQLHGQEIDRALKLGRYLIGNYRVEPKNFFHSVVLRPQAGGKIELYDPWDGFCSVLTRQQIFETGFLTSLGRGIIRWVQFIR